MHDKSGIDHKTEMLAIAARQAKSAIAIVSAEGSIEWVNECFVGMTGYSKEEVTGRKNTDVFEELTVGDGTVLFPEQPAPADAESVTQEVYCKRKDGSCFWAEISFNPVFDEQDTLMLYVAVGTEITEKKEVLERLQQELNLNNQILQSLEEGYLLVDEDANIHDVNPAYCRMVGYTKEELLSMSLHEVRPSMSPEYQQQFIERIKAEGSIEFETQHRTKDGEMIDLNASAAAIKKDGKIYLAGFVRDVTDRKSIQRRLKRSEQEFKSLFDNNPNPVFHLDSEGFFKRVNDAFISMSGYKKDELLDIHFSRLVAPEYHQDVAKRFKEAMQGEPQEHELTAITSSGKQLQFLVNSFPITVENEIVGISGIANNVTEKRKAERKIRESEQRFKSLFEHNPHAVYYMDLEGNYLGVNSKLEDLSGYSRQELLELNFAPLITESDLEKTQKHFEKAAGGVIQEYEVTGITRQGEEKPIRVTNFPMIIDDEIVGVFGIAEDITARKQAEEKLKRSEERWQHLIESSPLPVQVTIEGEIIYINKAGADLYGVENPEELSGESVFSFNAPGMQKKIKARIKRMNEGLAVDPYHNHKIINKKGVERYVEVHSVPINYRNKQAVQSIYRDITKQKIAEQKLKKSEERWHQLVEENPNPVQVTADGEIEFINEAGVQLYEAESAEALVGKSVLDFAHPDDLEEIKQRKYKLENDLEVDQISENRIISLAGNEKYIEVHSIPITYKGKQAIQTNIYDVTDRKEKQELVQRSLKEKEVLLQEIHHRVKNNMAVVSGLLQLQAMNTDNKEVASILKESEMRILSMAMIHEKLYASESLSEINFEEYIKELSQTIIDSNQNNHKDISIKYNLEEVHLDINTAIPCGLILNELIVNCFKHAFKNRDKGSVLVGLTQKENRLCIFVEDNGSGLPEDFEIKSQDSLGMTLVKTLTRQLGGELTITEGEGSLGSCFMLVINSETEK